MTSTRSASALDAMEFRGSRCAVRTAFLGTSRDVCAMLDFSASDEEVG